jgi:hypothetical protein
VLTLSFYVSFFAKKEETSSPDCIAGKSIGIKKIARLDYWIAAKINPIWTKWKKIVYLSGHYCKPAPNCA